MIQRQEQNGILTLRLEYGKANLLDVEFCNAITSALREASGTARAVIMTGTGSIFSAGVDLIRLTKEGPAYVARFYPALIDFLTELFAFSKPLVAAINGHAIAGGCLLAAAADYRLISGGTIGVPELAVGVPFPAVAIEILRFAAGTNAQKLATSGEVVPAQEAKARGLVDEFVQPDRLMARATEVAMRLASAPSEAFRITKHHLREPFLREARAHAAADRDGVAVWSDPRTHDHIREYLQRTLKRG